MARLAYPYMLLGHPKGELGVASCSFILCQKVMAGPYRRIILPYSTKSGCDFIISIVIRFQ